MRTIARALAVAALVGGTLAPPATVASTPGITGIDLVLPTGLTVSGLVRDTADVPVQGADVGLCAAPDDCFTASTTSASDGTWTLRGLHPGSYYVKAIPPTGANLLSVFHGSQPGGVHDPAQAEPISLTTDMEGIELAMPAGLRISGLVKDPEGDPVSGVDIRPSCDVPDGSGGTSGTDGAYEAVGLPPGATCVLAVSPPSNSDFPRGYAADDTVQSDYGGTQFVLGDTDLGGADVTLFRGRIISGQLDGVTGAGISVSAMGELGGDETPVADDGTFAMHGLWPGTYRVLFTVASDANDESQFPYGIYNGDGQVLASQYDPGVTVDVTSGDVAGLGPVLPDLPSMSGTVSDTQGPVAGARVSACDVSLGCASVVTGNDGSYHALNLPDGSYAVVAGAAHHVQAWYAPGGSVTDPDLAAPVAVSGSDVSGVNVQLPIGGSISGRVTGPSGEPVVGANVSAVPAEGGISEFGPGGAVTADNGDYDVTGLADGDYVLWVSPAENTSYFAGYWSEAGYTPDRLEATLIHVGTLDVTPPAVTAPKASFRVGATLGTKVPVHLAWSGSDVGTGIDHYEVQQSTNGGAWTLVASPTVPRLDRALSPSSTRTYRFRVRAFDAVGNHSTWAAGPTLRVRRTQESSGAIGYRGTWRTALNGSASGGAYRWTSASRARASYTFAGRAVAWVARIGSGYGKAKVYIDGGLVATVDLHAGSTAWRRIVYSRTWASVATHTIRVVCLATAGHPRIDVDAFTVLR